MRTTVKLLVATATDLVQVDPDEGSVEPAAGLEGRRPSCVAIDPWNPERAWCGVVRGGILRSDDAGASWRVGGLEGEDVTAVTASPARRDLLWAGTEPSALWRSTDGGERWERAEDLRSLPSAPEWSFPPKPETHHVRWIACHPEDRDRLWLAIEAGALVSTRDGGRSFRDRVPGGPWDTHELAIHPSAPETLRAAAGDGYFESRDAGERWATPRDGLEVGYLRSIAIDPGDPARVVVSASSRPRSAYVAGRSDGRLYRREGSGPWKRILAGWPEPPDTIAPLLAAGTRPGEMWAADERGIHRSDDAGATWALAARFRAPPSNLRGLGVFGRSRFLHEASDAPRRPVTAPVGGPTPSTGPASPDPSSRTGAG